MSFEAHWVYLILCEDGSYYTGMTKSVVRRFNEHLKGHGSVHIKYRRWVKLLQCWLIFGSRADAMRIERFIKNKGKDFRVLIGDDPTLLPKAIKAELNWAIQIRIVETQLVERKIIEAYPELTSFFEKAYP